MGAMGGFGKSVRGILDPQYGQRVVYNRTRGDIRDATNRYMELVMQRQGIDPAQFAQAAQQAVLGSGMGDVYGGFQALPGQFYGQQYMGDLNRAVMGQSAQGALGAGRMASMAGGQRGAMFGGAAEQARRAGTDLSAQTGATLAGARAQAEQSRAGLATQGLQGQLAASQGIMGMLGQGYLGGLNQEQAFRLAQLQSLTGLGQTGIGALGGIGSSYLGNSGTGWGQKMIENWGSAFLGGGGGGLMCWVADELWGEDDPRTHAARRFANANRDHWFMREYAAHGREWAASIRANPELRELARPIWGTFARLGA